MTADTRIFYVINHFARDTPWLYAIVSGYAAYGVVLFAALLVFGAVVSVAGYILLRPFLRRVLTTLAGTPLSILFVPQRPKAAVRQKKPS